MLWAWDCGKIGMEFSLTFENKVNKRCYSMNEDRIICYCSNVSEKEIIDAILSGAKSLDDIRRITKACTIGRCKELSPNKRCCSPDIMKILDRHLSV